MIVSAVYALCGLTCWTCAGLLLRAYRQTRSRLLLWSGIGFSAFGLSNILLFLDLVMFPDVDLSLARTVMTIIGVVLLLRGLIWEGCR
ncbi:MAG: DUF5985 family protein [Opitutus sp.]